MDTDAVIDRIAHGELQTDIAVDLGMSPQRLSQILAGHPDIAAAREAGLERRLDQTERTMDGAQTFLEVSRTRELWKVRSWRAEREAPGRWGSRQHLQVETLGDLGDALRRARTRVIDHGALETPQDVQVLPPANQDAAGPLGPSTAGADADLD